MKVLILNQLADKAKARLPTFSHNLHLNIHSISLTFSDIHQKPTCRLFDSIQFCVASVLVIHRIFFVSTSAIPVNRCLTECDFVRKTTPFTGQVVQNTTCPWKPTISRTNCISRVNGFRNWWPGPHNRVNQKPGEFTFLPKWNMPNYSNPAYPVAQHLSSRLTCLELPKIR